MKITDRVARWFGYERRGYRMRGYEAGSVNRLTGDWSTTVRTEDAELRHTLSALRARSRVLAQNNDYAVRFFSLLCANVIGDSGIGLQMRVKNRDGSEDRQSNKLIEDAWRDWGRMRYASRDQRSTWIDLQNLVLRAVACDGEVFIRKHVADRRENKYVFTLQVLEADHCDERYSANLTDGHTVRSGIEFDASGRRVAYYFLRTHPGEWWYGGGNKYATERERVPAAEVIHLYLQKRPTQSRGVPWMHAAMLRLNILGGYEEAELVSSRVAASKMGFFTTPDGTAESIATENESGEFRTAAAPGEFGVLPDGYKFEPWNPTHPSGNFEPFTKSILRGVASGLNINYNSLANNLEGVSFSSIRQGVLEDRYAWRSLQRWFIEHFCVPVFESWLSSSLLAGAIDLPESLPDKFNSPLFRPRGWDWVDPLKDMEASVLAINNGLITRTQILAEQGLDFEDVVDQLAAEQEVLKQKGIIILTSNGKNDDDDSDEQD